MRSLKTQLLFSHLALVIIMTGVMAFAVVTFFHLGRSVSRILRDNYDSVVAAQNMKESLERMDSAATFYLAGQDEKARRQYQTNAPIFQKWLTVEQHNITEPGEQKLADDLNVQFQAYRHAVEQMLFRPKPYPGAEDRHYYFAALEPSFLGVKRRAQQILDLNQTAIVNADRRAREESRVAAWAALGITAAAFLAALALARRSIRQILNPLRTFAAEAEAIGAGDLNRQIDLKRDDEIGALANSYNRMTRNLREARRGEEQRIKTEFISVAAHELRTPVTSLQLSVELLLEGAGGALTADQRPIVMAQQRDLARLQTLMQELLDTERLESGAMATDFQPAAVQDIVHAAMDSVRSQAAAKSIDLQEIVASGLSICADRAQMTRVLVNLLSNAIRHTPEAGHITVETSEGESGTVLIAVRDSGEGIPAEYLPRIFDRFVQAPGATGNGAGLGLSIAQSIVKAHSGDINGASVMGEGTVFTISLPSQASSAKSTSTEVG